MTAKEILDDKIKNYYLKELTYSEIGKLLDLSSRTIQRHIKNSNLKSLSEPKTLQEKAFELHKRGFSYSEIARMLKISKSTVYNWHRKKRNL